MDTPLSLFFIFIFYFLFFIFLCFLVFSKKPNIAWVVGI